MKTSKTDKVLLLNGLRNEFGLIVVSIHWELTLNQTPINRGTGRRSWNAASKLCRAGLLELTLERSYNGVREKSTSAHYQLTDSGRELAESISKNFELTIFNDDIREIK